MKKKRSNSLIYIGAITQIFILVTVSFAFSFLLSDRVKLVSALCVNGLDDETGLSCLTQQNTPPPKGIATIPTGTSASLKFNNGQMFVPSSGSATLHLESAVGNIKAGSDISSYVANPSGGGYVTFSDGSRLAVDSATGSAIQGQMVQSTAFPGYSGAKTPFGTAFPNTPLAGYLLSGLLYASLAAGVIQLIGGIAGADKNTINALTGAAFGGIMAGKLVQGLIVQTNRGVVNPAFGGLRAGTWGVGVGVVVAVAIFILMYKQEKRQLVSFQCLPYEPPLGGAKCEECNKDPFRPCSEYRCRSLGQACQLLNPGTKEEKCAWVSPKDVTSPTITPSTDALKPADLRYISDTSVRPPALGVKVVSSGGGCLPAFTPLEFGIVTNEPAQCKIDYNHTNSFTEMQYFFGESNYFEYNHTQKMRLPGPDNSPEGELAPLLKNDGTFALYVRCTDANGNQNVDEYSINFCVDQGPDTTPPVIEATSLPSGSYVTFNSDQVPIELYVNEPSECKWSHESKTYEDMENSMECAKDASQINADLRYTCSGNLSGIENKADNKFYFRCKDQPSKPENERNVNVQSYELLLKGSQPLNIIKVAPNETVIGSSESVKVDLEVETDDGAEEGKAICYYSPSGDKDSYIKMFETDSFIHKQTLSLLNGTYEYFFRCVDSGGNAAEANVMFDVKSDRDAPKVTRAYKQDALKIVTDEDAECVYSLTTCNYNFEEATKKMIYSNPDIKNSHYAEWSPSAVYYIKCRDMFGNEPDPNKCSIVVSAVQLSKK